VKSEASLLRRLAIVSVSVVAVIFAYKLGKEQHRTRSVPTAAHPQKSIIGLKEGQTIVGVADTKKAMCFYLSNEDMES
jgi:hypothetical protein